MWFGCADFIAGYGWQAGDVDCLKRHVEPLPETAARHGDRH
jgi:hypothetical protein